MSSREGTTKGGSDAMEINNISAVPIINELDLSNWMYISTKMDQAVMVHR